MSGLEDAQLAPSIVHVVDDHEGIRALVARALSSVGIQCVGWDGPFALLSALEDQKIDTLVVDIRLVGMSGIELVRRLRDRGVAPPFIFISGVDEVPVAIEAMKLGAHDFLPKPFSAQTLIDTVQSALHHSQIEKGRDARIAAVRSLVAKLSPRERQVLLAVVDGKPNKVVAIDLGLSEKTVEEHRSHVMSKLGASSVPDLVKLAIVAGLCDPAATLPGRQT
jgi:FixJ family two-component response regulator